MLSFRNVNSMRDVESWLCWGLMVLAALFAGVYLECFYEVTRIYFEPNAQGLVTGYVSGVILIRCAAFCLLCLLAVVVTRLIPKRCYDSLYRFRYPVAFAIIAMCVMLELSFSSIAYLANSTPGGTTDGLLFGVPRAIRSDEYNVSTLWNISQAHNGYSAWSTILRGDLTDTRLVYNLPSLSVATLFRPFHWGYVIFGSAKGLSFQMVGRLVFTFMACFECFRILSKDKRACACIFACMMTFSPIVLWWNVWEGLIYGQFLVVALYYFLHSEKRVPSVLWALCIAWLCGCYVMILYPAWMVPFFYVFALAGIWVLVDYCRSAHRVEGGAVRRKVAALVVSLVAVALALFWVFMSSSAALNATSNTVYPGARFEMGGGALLSMFNYGASLFFPLAEVSAGGAPGNSCELSSVMSLFPLGSICAAIAFIKTRDLRIGLLLGVQVAFLLYVAVGFPPFLAKITLLSNSQATRVTFASGYTELCLLLLSAPMIFSAPVHKNVGNCFKPFKLICIGAGSVAIALCIWGVASVAIPGYGRLLFSLLFVIFISSFVFTLIMVIWTRGSSRWISSLFCIAVCCVVVPGLCVHPVQQGIAPVTESASAEAISEVVSRDPDAKWLVDESCISSNLCVALGASTITSTNAYPDLQLWGKLDSTGRYEDVYNRYAHVHAVLTDANTSFEVLAGDQMQVNLNYADLKTLNVEYVISKRRLDAISLSGIAFESVSELQGITIYRVSYSR